MAVIRVNVPAATKDLYARQWLFTIVETMQQEQDDGRLVYVAQATGKRMTRADDGKFVGLDGSAVTEADMLEGFLTPTFKVQRLEMTIGFEGDDEAATMADLKETITGPQFTKIKAALKMITGIAMAEKVKGIEGAAIVADEQSPLDRM